MAVGAIRQQAITWTNVDPDLCRYMASLGDNELFTWIEQNSGLGIHCDFDLNWIWQNTTDN